jgi:hypothetical protein
MSTSSQIPVLPVLTAEQHQRILFGPYFNGVDQPLKPLDQVRDQICTSQSYRRLKWGNAK